MTIPIKHCPQPDPPELVMRADGYHYQSEDEMQDTQRELTDEQIDDLGFTARIHLAAPGTGKQAEAARTLVRAAIAADRALNAPADRDVMRQALENIVQEHQAFCEHHVHVQSHAYKLVEIAERALAAAPTLEKL